MKQQPVIYTVKSMFEEAARPLRAKIKKLRTELAGKATTEVLERVAAAQSADPATDDLTVCLALEVADLTEDNNCLRREKAELVEALETSSTMMEALATQLHSWGQDPVVNWRGQLAKNAALSSATETGDLPSVNWKDGEPYSYCPECGRQEPILRSATEMKDGQS